MMRLVEIKKGGLNIGRVCFRTDKAERFYAGVPGKR